MNKSEYSLLLMTPEWDLVRRRILNRDAFVCRKCGTRDCKLNVHHKKYIDGKMPWEVPDNFLITLCDRCHSKAHEGRLISSFIEFNKKPKKRKPTKSKIWVAGKGLIDAPGRK